MSGDVRDVLRELAAVDRRGAVWVATLCAASVLHLVPEGERRPAHAVRLARRWARGCEVGAEALRHAQLGSLAAMHMPSYNVALVAYRLKIERAGRDAYNVNLLSITLTHAAETLATAGLPLGEVVHGTLWSSLVERHALALAEIVAHHTSPVAPALADVLRCRPRAAVVWDAADVAALGPVRLGSLGDALARATRGGWRWACPVERAIAERLDEAHPVLARVRRAA